MLKTLLLFGVLVAVAYVVFVRHRGWHVEHYAPHARRAHFTVCLVLAVLVASIVSYLVRDEVLCPAGSTYHDVVSTKTQTGKGGIGIECVGEAGAPVSGSVFAGLCAWLAMSIGVFATVSAIWRRLGPPAPPEPPAEPAAQLEVPRDKRERRRERNRARRDRGR
ncbi:MAG: hypothetical protein HOV81_17945 [Kofleriaceae bacterium]|nr:hypothetical protein [Kofleriaceae bacterium]